MGTTQRTSAVRGAVSRTRFPGFPSGGRLVKARGGHFSAKCLLLFRDVIALDDNVVVTLDLEVLVVGLGTIGAGEDTLE